MYAINNILEIIQKTIPELQAVYIFGSSGTIYETPESDLDIAILASYYLDPLQKWNLSKKISQFVQRDVDIVDLKTASTVMRFEILKSGKRIYSKDPIASDLFETAMFSAYVHFVEDRQALINDIKTRGGQILNG